MRKITWRDRLRHAFDNSVELGQSVNFYTLLESARRQGQIALGYRLARHQFDAHQSYGVVVNPHKSAQVTLEKCDRLIVLAEN